MGTKYDNLRSKTIFDFTRDEKILKEILSEYSFEEYMENPELTIEESNDWNEIVRIGQLVEFSKMTNDNKLYDMLKNELDDEFPILFDEMII